MSAGVSTCVVVAVAGWRVCKVMSDESFMLTIANSCVCVTLSLRVARRCARSMRALRVAYPLLLRVANTHGAFSAQSTLRVHPPTRPPLNQSQMILNLNKRQ